MPLEAPVTSAVRRVAAVTGVMAEDLAIEKRQPWGTSAYNAAMVWKQSNFRLTRCAKTGG
jgi:hypothetical protein